MMSERENVLRNALRHLLLRAEAGHSRVAGHGLNKAVGGTTIGPSMFRGLPGTSPEEADEAQAKHVHVHRTPRDCIE